MKTFLIILSIIISHGVQAADVSGNVFLENNSNSENITITFSPVSPGAVFSQISPNVNGSYTTTVENGVYNVIFEQAGYQTLELTEVFLNGNIILDDVVLLLGTIQEISGEINGAFTNDIIYIVVGDIVVPAGETLTIEAGTEIKFDGYYKFLVRGSLIANGTENEYIRFTSNSSSPTNSDWEKISFLHNYNTSSLNYCIIEYGTSVQSFAIINLAGGNISINNSIIRHTNKDAIYVNGGPTTATITDNTIYDCESGIYIDSDNTNTNIIEGNELFDIDFHGITASFNLADTHVRKNIIHNVGLSGIFAIGDINISRNIIYNSNSTGILVVSGQPNINNNTIFNVIHGIEMSSSMDNPSPNINSNIIAFNSGYAIYTDVSSSAIPQLVTYNLFYENALGLGNNNLPAGVGVIATTNNNGVDSDVYYNIFSNPELESLVPTDLLFCYPTATSDAVNAGDPSIVVLDGRADIGAIELGDLLDIANLELESVAVYPNPVGQFVNFTAASNVQFDQIDLIDLHGRNILKHKLRIPVSNFQLVITGKLSSGIYLYTVSNGGKIITQGRLLKK
jgi:hypothetical protein